MSDCTQSAPQDRADVATRFSSGNEWRYRPGDTRTQRAAAEAAEARTVADEIAASMRKPPNATERIAIERLARLVVDARRMRRSGRFGIRAMLEVERQILSGTRQLGLSGYDPRPTADHRRELRSNTSNSAAADHVARRRAQHEGGA